MSGVAVSPRGSVVHTSCGPHPEPAPSGQRTVSMKVRLKLVLELNGVLVGTRSESKDRSASVFGVSSADRAGTCGNPVQTDFSSFLDLVFREWAGGPLSGFGAGHQGIGHGYDPPAVTDVHLKANANWHEIRRRTAYEVDPRPPARS